VATGDAKGEVAQCPAAPSQYDRTDDERDAFEHYERQCRRVVERAAFDRREAGEHDQHRAENEPAGKDRRDQDCFLDGRKFLNQCAHAGAI
jgi:hypothetical protein